MRTITCECGVEVEAKTWNKKYCEKCVKECGKEHKKKYYHKNKKRELGKQKEYRKENKEKLKEYRKENKEKINLRNRIYYRNKTGSPEYWELRDLIKQFKGEVSNGKS
jgi:hypothetical protein